MAKISVKLIRSRIGASPHQRAMLDALGLRRMGKVRTFNDTSSIRGIIRKVPHLVGIVKED